MIYAPVMIPTLNRYEHFKQCLDSLENCIGADKTEVYVALDYPPNMNYMDGWKKTDQYLAEKEKNNRFGKLIVIRRDYNYGVFNEHSNILELKKLVTEKYDRYIFSEDDNIFSPNFLEYINKGLEKYCNDDTVYAICGYTQPYDFLSDDNDYFRHNSDFSAWGFGCLVVSTQKAEREIENGYLRDSFSISNLKKVVKHGYNRLYQYITYCFWYKKDYMPITDCVLTCYLIVKDMHVICPTISKVRNIGWDESGQSFKNPKLLKKFGDIAKRHKTQIIDEDSTFEFVGDEWAYYDYNNCLTAKVSEAKMSFGQFIYKTFIFFIKLLGKKMGLNPIARKLKKMTL